MQKEHQIIGFEKGFTPGWSWRAVVVSACVTVLLYVALPYLEKITLPAQSTLSVRSVSTISPPAPVVMPPEPVPPSAQEKPLPPPLEQMARPLILPAANLALHLNPGELAGNLPVAFLAVDFGDAGMVDIFALSDLDEPPRAIVQARPQYPPSARLRQQEGYVVVEFIVRADGMVETPIVVESMPAQTFDQAAVQAVSRWRFSPGMREGAPVAVRVRQRVAFRLQ